jgi:hypothetical protein
MLLSVVQTLLSAWGTMASVACGERKLMPLPNVKFVM